VTALKRQGLIPLVAAILGRLPVDALVGPMNQPGSGAPDVADALSPDDWLADWEPGSGVVQ